ncbi:MAG: dUTP diphosphatase [Candidatus Omnitrophica bacterium]|nr:dUTP diphosphatase [Candidatus Omnitrophota bacterium]
MPTVPVQISKKNAEIQTPAYHRPGDAGLDLRANESITLAPGQRYPVKTGLHFAIPDGVVGLIKDRSGLALKFGLHTLAGVIDSNYRGEIMVVLINLGEKEYQVNTGDRIAQLILLPCLQADLTTVSTLPETERNDSGFGSSGKT